MAFLDATQWNDLQASEAVNEKRFNALGIVGSIVDSTPFIDYIPPSGIEAFNTLSSLRNFQFPVINDQQVTVVTTPGFGNIPSNLPTSANYTFQAYDVFSGFRHYPAANSNNQIDSDWQREQVMLNVAHECANSIETILAARLEERKTQLLDFTTQVSQGDGTFTFNATPDELQINKAAQKETMFFNLQQLLAANKLPGEYRLVTSRAGLSVQMSEAAKFGVNNDRNLQALGFLPTDRLYESDNISAGSDIFNGWFLRDGSIGVYENFPWDFRNRTEIGGRMWSVSDVQLPFARMRANIYVNNEATEATSLISTGTDSNLRMTHFEEMAIWFRFYVVFRYNSDLATRAQDIVKVKGLTT